MAKKLSKSDAEKYCGPFDEAVCRGEYIGGKDQFRWRTSLVSTPAENEMKDAVIPAFNKACIKSKYDGKFLFWSGAVKIESGKLAFSDGSSTSDFSFDPWIKEGSDCVAFDNNGGMHVVKCSTKLPFMCKIQPASH